MVKVIYWLLACVLLSCRTPEPDPAEDCYDCQIQETIEIVGYSSLTKTAHFDKCGLANALDFRQENTIQTMETRGNRTWITTRVATCSKK